MSLDLEDDYPLLEWAADRGVVPEPTCTLCWGEGSEGTTHCPCLVAAVVAAFPEAAAAAEASTDCLTCDGDGADVNDEVCGCLTDDLRVRQEKLESSSFVDD